ncbi:MAG TPA: hypothetical protein VF730_05180 [Terracidiphilus sp.]
MSHSVGAIVLFLFLGLPASSQSTSAIDPDTLTATPTKPSAQLPAEAVVTPAVRMVADFKNADVKFDMSELVDILRDRKHEGWVLAAYPDPRTGQPLIGAGFSLDLPEREHPQTDPLNSHQFLEPSSADLWQAAGFDPERRKEILKLFYQRKRKWSKRTWRRRLYSLPAQISDEDATQLVRVGAIQAIYNARAYCRNFGQWTGPQQMAMTQLVYQMGVNLQHFDNFLAAINSGTESSSEQSVAAMDSATFAPAPVAATIPVDENPEFWQGVQKSLIGSQWAHKYRTRAITVIAMLDPAYQEDPSAAERRVGVVLRPAVVHRRHRHASTTRRQVAARTHRRHPRKGRTMAQARGRERA